MSDGRVTIDADDAGLLLGWSAFETLRTYDGIPFEIDAHLERLAASCMAMRISVPDISVVRGEIEWAASQVPEDCVVRVTITRGGRRIVRAASLPVVDCPFRCVTRLWVPPPWLDGTVKHSSRAYSRLAVLDAGVEEVIWMDEAGFLLEGTRSNIFAVVGGALQTPPIDGRLLAGVTRSAVIDVAVDLGVPVLVQPMHQDGRFDELYVCSTLKELTPIDELNGRPAPAGGPVGAKILSAFREQVGR